MFGLVNQRVQAQRRVHHMRMREDERFSNFLTKFQDDAFDCGFNETALKAALRYAIADRLINRLQYSQEPTSYADFVQHLLRIDARYWEVRDSLDDRERLRSGRMSSRYYSAASNYYGSSNSNTGGTYNRNYNRPDYKKKQPNHRKFVKKEKAKGATIDDDTELETENYADESDHESYGNSDHESDEVPQPIDDDKELRTAFRRFN